MVRVAVHCTEIDVGEQHIKLGKELGMDVVAFFMMTHMTSPEELAKQAKMAEDYGADIIVVADSAGAQLPMTLKPGFGAILQGGEIAHKVHMP